MQTGKEEAEMKFKRNVALKSGESCVLRSLCAKDAREALAVCKKAAEETRNLIRYADEWTMTEEEEAAFIKRQEDDPNALMLGAFLSGRLIGIASFAPRASLSRVRHRAELGVMVLKSCWGKGVATAMIEALLERIQDTPFEQLELEVVAENERARRLYERFGFCEFARHPRKLKYRDGTYADMILMMLELKRI